MPKKRVTKKSKTTKPLTPSEKFQQLIKENKVLSRPIYSGDAQIEEENKRHFSRQVVSGYAQVGVAQGITFSEDDQSRSSTWHRLDTWVVVFADPNHLDEVHSALQEYVVDKLAEKYESIMDSLDE